jgi:hypothetical protein
MTVPFPRSFAAEHIGAPGGKVPMFCAPKLLVASMSMGHP